MIKDGGQAENTSLIFHKEILVSKEGKGDSRIERSRCEELGGDGGEQ